MHFLPCFQSRVLQLSWKLLPVFACCATTVDSILLQVLKEPEAGKVIVKKDMVVLVFQVLRQLLYHMCSKAYFTIFLPV